MASKQIPEKFLDLLTGKKALASIATVMPDGSPQVTRSGSTTPTEKSASIPRAAG
jgi:hypothetical protein